MITFHDHEKSPVTCSVQEQGSLSDKDSPAIITTGAVDFNDKLDVEKYGSTKRGLKARHVNLMIIGQTIGTGLFIGLGSPLYKSGSLSLLLGFIAWSMLGVMPLIFATATFASYLPINGCFIHLAARVVDPALGFAVNIIYIYTCMMFVALEAVGVASVIQFWTGVNPAVFIAVCIVVWFLVNAWGVKYYGEIEAASAFIKVLLIIGLMFFGLITMSGGNPKGDAFGFRNWGAGGLFKDYLVEGPTGRFLGWWSTLLYAAFACGGPDQIGLLGGEMVNPRRLLPSAARATYFRICFFYFGGIFFMCALCSSINPKLVEAQEAGSGGILSSPWVIGIQDVGVSGLASLVNACVMTSAFSCGNGFLYGATRSLYASSLAGYTPRFFSKCLKNGTPIYALLASLAVGCLAFLSCSEGTNVVFNWFINLSTTGMLCTYVSLWITYFKFRKAIAVQMCDVKSPEYPYYKGPFWLTNWFAYFSFGFCLVVLFFNGFWIFFPGQFAVADLFSSYFAPVMFPILYFGWKFIKKTKIRSPEEADLTTGKKEVDEDQEECEAARMNNPRKGLDKWIHKVLD
ncbi:dicarboxylic amino acid permease [Diutina catenulata]